ncbi:MAG: MBL fold metallo-hydrolase [Sphaerobacter sp.]|nr:MBL fold metallo-hydrolase [Sphaerobacter sp.]
MRVTSFGSGSSGNALLIQSGGTNVLIDAGLAVRRLRAGLAAAGVPDGGLDALLLSHEHHDHVSAVPSLIRYHHGPIFATRGTMRALEVARPDRWETLAAERPCRIGTLEITPIAVPHDAAEPVGFFIDDGSIRVAIFTDLGSPAALLRDAVARAHLVVLEANYDLELLERGPYPAYLKRRIRSGHGHLSNDECGELLTQSLTSVTVDIWLAHLSENNNRPALAEQTVTRWLGAGSNGPRVRPLPRHGRPAVWDAAAALQRPRQLGLPLP